MDHILNIYDTLHFSDGMTKMEEPIALVHRAVDSTAANPLTRSKPTWGVKPPVWRDHTNAKQIFYDRVVLNDPLVLTHTLDYLEDATTTIETCPAPVFLDEAGITLNTNESLPGSRFFTRFPNAEMLSKLMLWLTQLAEWHGYPTPVWRRYYGDGSSEVFQPTGDQSDFTRLPWNIKNYFRQISTYVRNNVLGQDLLFNYFYPGDDTDLKYTFETKQTVGIEHQFIDNFGDYAKYERDAYWRLFPTAVSVTSSPPGIAFSVTKSFEYASLAHPKPLSESKQLDLEIIIRTVSYLTDPYAYVAVKFINGSNVLTDVSYYYVPLNTASPSTIQSALNALFTYFSYANNCNTADIFFNGVPFFESTAIWKEFRLTFDEDTLVLGSAYPIVSVAPVLESVAHTYQYGYNLGIGYYYYIDDVFDTSAWYTIPPCVVAYQYDGVDNKKMYVRISYSTEEAFSPFTAIRMVLDTAGVLTYLNVPWFDVYDAADLATAVSGHFGDTVTATYDGDISIDLFVAGSPIPRPRTFRTYTLTATAKDFKVAGIGKFWLNRTEYRVNEIASGDISTKFWATPKNIDYENDIKPIIEDEESTVYSEITSSVSYNLIKQLGWSFARYSSAYTKDSYNGSYKSTLAKRFLTNFTCSKSELYFILPLFGSSLKSKYGAKSETLNALLEATSGVRLNRCDVNYGFPTGTVQYSDNDDTDLPLQYKLEFANSDVYYTDRATLFAHFNTLTFYELYSSTISDTNPNAQQTVTNNITLLEDILDISFQYLVLRLVTTDYPTATTLPSKSDDFWSPANLFQTWDYRIGGNPTNYLDSSVKTTTIVKGNTFNFGLEQTSTLDSKLLLGVKSGTKIAGFLKCDIDGPLYGNEPQNYWP